MYIHWISHRNGFAMRVQVARWGNSLGVRVPKDIARQVGLTEGARVEMTAQNDQITITVQPSRYRLEDLLEGMTPQAMSEAFAWDDDLGREAVE